MGTNVVELLDMRQWIEKNFPSVEKKDMFIDGNEGGGACVIASEANGSAMLTGGITPYTYVWSNGDTLKSTTVMLSCNG